MAIPPSNIQKSAIPIPKTNFPHNRIYQKVQGQLIKVGSVIRVGHTGPGDNWWSLSEAHGIRPWLTFPPELGPLRTGIFHL